MIVIALGHRSRVGKDLGGKFLETWLRLKFPKLRVGRSSFADSLKAITHDLFKGVGLKTKEYYEENQVEKVVPLSGAPDWTPVKVWIEFGTTMCRAVDPLTWVRKSLAQPLDICIICDVRFPNEVAEIRRVAEKSILIRIDRTEAPNYNSVADDALNDFTEWDVIVSNNGTIQEYHQAIISAVERFL